MAKEFKVGDHASETLRRGHVTGRIVRVHTTDVNYNEYVHHASKDDPQYQIKSDKTDPLLCTRGRR